MTEDELDKRLLGMVLNAPRRTLIVGIATGMAVGLELAQTRAIDALERLSVNAALCERACSVVLRQWAESSRVGHIDDVDFNAMCKRIVRIARSS